MLKYNKALNERAKELRKNMTASEKILWHKYLKGYLIRFRRQKIIGDYIVDFYCSKASLVVELDGGHHYEENKIKLDYKRTVFLNAHKIKVIRFTNEVVKLDFASVCMTIDAEVKARI